MSDVPQHKVWVINALDYGELEILDDIGIDTLRMQPVGRTPIVIETCGVVFASVSYGYTAQIPLEKIQPLIAHRPPTITETLEQPPAGILTRLRAWLTAHIFPQEARDEHDDR